MTRPSGRVRLKVEIMSEEISKTKQAVIEAYERGYRIKEDGSMINPKGKPVRGWIKRWRGMEYRHHTITIGSRSDGKRNHYSFGFHRLAGLQKFGREEFIKDLHIRHLNSDSLDNSLANIGIGTASQNMMDKPKDQRVAIARIASSHIQRKDWPEIEADRKEGMSYRALAEKYGLSKGTLSYHFSMVSKHRKKDE